MRLAPDRVDTLFDIVIVPEIRRRDLQRIGNLLVIVLTLHLEVTQTEAPALLVIQRADYLRSDGVDPDDESVVDLGEVGLLFDDD